MGALLLPARAPFRVAHSCRGRRGERVACSARRQARKGRKQQREEEEPDGEEGPTMTRILLEGMDELPTAPPVGSRPPRLLDESPYPVFAPKPGTEAASAPWRWEDADLDDEPGTSSESDAAAVPAWNPRTGFMRTAAELQAEAEAAAEAAASSAAAPELPSVVAAWQAADAAAAAAAAASSSSSTRPPRVASTSRRRPAFRPAPPEISLTSPAPLPPPAASPSSSSTTSTSGPASDAAAAPSPPAPAPLPPLPPASREAVLGSALGTGFWMAAIALFVRNYAALNSAASMGTDPAAVEALLRWPAGLESAPEAAAAAGAAAVVTGARFALLRVWPELRAATDRSNTQILTPLGPVGICLVALASGLPEELLFRGALIPATFPDWRGAALSAVVFGALHTTGGRNPAFAAWAGAVGAVYGAAYLATGNVWVPVAAHVAGNAASAFIWKAGQAAAAAAAQEARGEAGRGRAAAGRGSGVVGSPGAGAGGGAGQR